MIELPVQTLLSALPGPTDSAISGANEVTGFAAQLAQMVVVAPVGEGVPLPPAGKILPPVYRPAEPASKLPSDVNTPNFVDLPEEPTEVELKPEQVLTPSIPIMRPLLSQFKAEPIALPDASTVATEAKAETSEASTSSPPIADSVDQMLTAAGVVTMPVIAAASANQTIATTIASAELANDSGSSGPLRSGVAKPAQPYRNAAPLPSSLTGTTLPELPHPPVTTAQQVVPAAMTPALLNHGKNGEITGNRRNTKSVTEALVAAVAESRATRLTAQVLPALELGQSTAPLAVVNPPAAPTLFAPLNSSSNSPAPPQDFAALIDRIVAAREASGAPVAVAVRHAEFGAVTLRFEQADGTLSVAASSPDPDFARAAAAALPPERPALAEQSIRDNGKAALQGDGQAQAQTHANTSGQSRHSSAAQPRTATNNPVRQSTTEHEARDSGIFA